MLVLKRDLLHRHLHVSLRSFGDLQSIAVTFFRLLPTGSGLFFLELDVERKVCLLATQLYHLGGHPLDLYRLLFKTLVDIALEHNHNYSNDHNEDSGDDTDEAVETPGAILDH